MKSKLCLVVLSILMVSCTNRIIKLNNFENSKSIILENEYYKLFFPKNKLETLIKYDLVSSKIDTNTYRMYIEILEDSNLPLILQSNGELLNINNNGKSALLVGEYDRKIIESNSLHIYDKERKKNINRIKVYLNKSMLTIKNVNGEIIYSNFYSFK